MINSSTEAYDRWVKLPVDDKKLLATNTELLTAVLESEESIAEWERLPVTEKQIKANNRDYEAKIGQSKKTTIDFNNLKIPPKELKITVKDFASKSIESIKSAINGLQDKTVNVGVTGSGSSLVTGGASLGTAIGRSQGGEVPEYHSDGGVAGVFKKKGTDTVPAMLTPGEFVQRKAAVNTFGLDFMERVNRLDIQGAFNAMTNRFNSQNMLAPSVSTVVNNINQTTTNANKVTQHVSGGNPDYMMQRASRYLK